MEAKLSDDRTPGTADAAYEKLDRDALIALLRSVTGQRDDILSKYEAMAFQVDESTREIDDAMLDARRNAKKADVCEHHVEEEETRIGELSRELDEERRKSAAIAAEFVRFRDAVERAPVEDPWSVLWRAASQIVADWVAWARAKIPPDSALLPWFDRTVDGAKRAGRLACKWACAFYDWAKPRVVELWKWLRSEVERRVRKDKE